MIKKLIYSLVLLPIVAIGQTTTQNYIKTSIYRDTTKVSNIAKAQESITYYDGLGRPIQQVSGKMSASGTDVVTHIEYDAFGRQVKEYLPYTGTASSLLYTDPATALTNTNNYYFKPAYENATNPYSEKFFEPSPLNRILKQAAPGDAWKGNADNDNDHTVKFSPLSNKANEVKKLTAIASWNATSKLYDIAFVSDGYYDANLLYKTITQDENKTGSVITNQSQIAAGLNTTQEFKNKQGQVVLKRTFNSLDLGGLPGENAVEIQTLDTYYVYDDFGNLTYVIPSKANGVFVDNLCYQYKYDNRNRLVEKKLPGKQWEFIVYDSLDRVIATGPALNPFTPTDANANWGWVVNYYDSFNRPAYSGWYPHVFTSTSRAALQANNTGTAAQQVRGFATVNEFALSYAIDVTTLPVSFQLLSVNFYDDYDVLGLGSKPVIVQGVAVETSAKGLPTASFYRILTKDPGRFLVKKTYYYDKKGRAIYTRTDDTNLGSMDIIENLFDFTGKPLLTKTRHYVAGQSDIIVTDNFTYNAQDRLEKQTQVIIPAQPN